MKIEQTPPVEPTYQLNLSENEVCILAWALGRTAPDVRDKAHIGWGNLGREMFDSFYKLGLARAN